jgi:uncharacterized protein YoxC
MNNDTLIFIISIAGSIIGLSFLIIGFFLSRLVGDVRHCIEETGKNKGKIELVEQQQRNDTKRIEEMTQLELKQMSHSVNELSKNVNILVVSLAQKGIEKNGN